jgi:hypothetical protein
MTIAARIEDAAVLMETGRWEGALLSTLVAIAGSSRQRFPTGTPSIANASKSMGDRECFQEFVRAQIPEISSFKSLSVEFEGQVRPIGEILYTWLRCTLAHEARLPPEIRFVPDTKVGHIEIGHHVGPPERIVLTHSIVILLADMVIRAEENAHLPKELRDRIIRLLNRASGDAA